MHRPLRYLATLSMCTLLFAAALSGGNARGQTIVPPTGTATPSPTPTVTPISTIPSGQDLVNQMSAAFKTKNTVHAVAHEVTDLTEPSTHVRVVIDLTQDESEKPLRGHVTGTVKTTLLIPAPAKTKTQHEQFIVAKSKVATKIGKKAWTCNILSTSSQTSTIVSIKNLGADTVNTVPVWHVQELATVDITGQTVPVTADYYISQADGTAVRSTTSDSLTSNGVTENATTLNDYSRYGETVHAKLPAACKGKMVSQRLVVSGQTPTLGQGAVLTDLGAAADAVTIAGR
jgi:hypothetical protein